MRKNKHYNSDSFNFFKDVRSTKRHSRTDPNYKTRLNGYDDIVSPRYNDYDNAFTANNLTSLSVIELSNQASSDLEKMYSFSNSKIQALKDYLLTNEEGRTHNTCLNCGMNEANTFDHFLPKGEFPHFSIHPKNLVPSCSNCNSKKSINWQSGDSSLFINFYLDDIPDIQFLFCDVISTPQSFKVNFLIQNTNGINPNLYSVIESHFNRLKICSRLNKFCNNTISEFVNDYLPYKDGRLNEFITQVNNSLVHHNDSFGINYWKNVLKSSLISSPIFQSYLTTKYP
jgi:hypothetical protein